MYFLQIGVLKFFSNIFLYFFKVCTERPMDVYDATSCRTAIAFRKSILEKVFLIMHIGPEFQIPSV